MIPKNELRTLIASLDYFDDAFGIGEELQSWLQKKKKELEVEEYPYLYDDDKKSLREFLVKCIEQIDNDNENKPKENNGEGNCENGHPIDKYTCPNCEECIACVDEGFREGCPNCKEKD
jgi:hypothetical protein